MKYFGLGLVFFVSTMHVTSSWNLKQLKIENPTIRDVKVFGRRAFLSLEISGNSPTLLEAPWPDNGFTRRFNIIPYPSAYYHTRRSCAQFYEVISIDVDKLGLLWVLDRGGMGCPAKVVLISLMTNSIVKTIWIQRDDIRGANVTTLCVDAQSVLPQAYIGTDSNILLVCSQLEKSCSTCILFIRRQIEADLEDFPQSDDVIASVLAIEDSKRSLFVTSHDKMALYSLELKSLDMRNTSNKANMEVSYQQCGRAQRLEVEYLGDKLAPSGLVLKDANAGFVYTSQRDYAILKWNTDQPLRAESHDVLLQSYPGVSCLSALFQAWGQLWGVSTCGGHCESQCTRPNGDRTHLTTMGDTSP